MGKIINQKDPWTRENYRNKIKKKLYKERKKRSVLWSEAKRVSATTTIQKRNKQQKSEETIQQRKKNTLKQSTVKLKRGKLAIKRARERAIRKKKEQGRGVITRSASFHTESIVLYMHMHIAWYYNSFILWRLFHALRCGMTDIRN